MISIFSQYIRNVRLLQYIGMNSLIFYAFHRPYFIPIADRLVDMLVDFSISVYQSWKHKDDNCLDFYLHGLMYTYRNSQQIFSIHIGKEKNLSLGD